MPRIFLPFTAEAFASVGIRDGDSFAVPSVDPRYRAVRVRSAPNEPLALVTLDDRETFPNWSSWVQAATRNPYSYAQFWAIVWRAAGARDDAASTSIKVLSARFYQRARAVSEHSWDRWNALLGRTPLLREAEFDWTREVLGSTRAQWEHELERIRESTPPATYLCALGWSVRLADDWLFVCGETRSNVYRVKRQFEKYINTLCND